MIGPLAIGASLLALASDSEAISSEWPRLPMRWAQDYGQVTGEWVDGTGPHRIRRAVRSVFFDYQKTCDVRLELDGFTRVSLAVETKGLEIDEIKAKAERIGWMLLNQEEAWRDLEPKIKWLELLGEYPFELWNAFSLIDQREGRSYQIVRINRRPGHSWSFTSGEAGFSADFHQDDEESALRFMLLLFHGVQGEW